MSSIIKDYEYDIFISYRQNDNKYDKWVTEFVSNLKKELEATIKDRVSIYLDENPDDGLLETHVHHMTGNIRETIEAYKKAIDISGRHNWALASLHSLLIEPSEYQNEAEAGYIYKELLTKEKVGYVSPFILALASASYGKNEEAIRYTRLALERHDPYITILVPGRPDNKTLLAIPEIGNMIRSIGLNI